MARRHPKSCRVCGASVPYVSVSATGLCPDHSRMRMETNIHSLRSRQGADFDAWSQAIARGVVRVVRTRKPVDGATETA